MKRVAVLGGTGFLGSNLCASLAAEGVSLIVPSRRPSHPGPVRVLPNAKVVRGDMHNVDALAALIKGCDAVVNLVGVLNAKGSGGKGFRKAHVGVTETAIAACQAAGVERFVLVSAIGAGEGESWYLKTKGEAEEVLKASSLEWTILRPSIIFGPGDGFFNRFAGLLRLAPMGLPIASPNAMMQPVYVDDVVNAIERALKDDATIGGVYELAGPKAYRFIDLVRIARDCLGMRRPVIGLPGPLGWMQAAFCEMLPGKPFSLDNLKSLKTDNVSDHKDFERLGIRPRSLEPIVRQYLAGTSQKQRQMSGHRRAAGR